MQQLLLMRVVQRIRHTRHDPHDIFGWQAATALVPKEIRRIGALDVIHRDPQLTVVLAAVMHTDDVRMPAAPRCRLRD